jgi:uncharacterized protein (TIGR02466 family)
MFASVTEQPIFATYVWVYDLEPEHAQRLNRQVFQDLDELTSPRPRLGPGQNWQTDQVLHQLGEFRELVDIFTRASKRVLDLMEVDYDRFEITGCWANINPRGAVHPPHFHPNNFLSGVYYVQAPPESDSITFHEPRPQVDMIAPRLRRHNKYNTPLQDIPVKPGRLILFPAWLTHSVRKNQSQSLRISISFNIMFPSFTETMSKPRWRGIPVGKTRRPPPGDEEGG